MATFVRPSAALPLVVADVAVLLLARPVPAHVIGDVRHSGQRLAANPDALVAELGGAALWCVGLWLAAALLLATGSRRSGRVGAASAAILRRMAPAGARRLLIAGAGFGITLAPIAASAHAAPTRSDLPATVSPAPAWPLDQPSLDQPSLDRPPLDQPPLDRPPLWPTDTAGPATGPTPQPAPTASAPRAVTVRAGDSLWSIAARSLGADPAPTRVAAAWPRWFAANHRVIGGDPALIHPGEVLHTPADEQGAAS